MDVASLVGCDLGDGIHVGLSVVEGRAMSEATERTTATIAIGKDIQYAKVSARLKEFHADNQSCSVETSVEFKEGHVLFAAKVTCGRGVFTGHSLGKTGAVKQFEKQETIAVGRALAFAGYLSSGEIASFEEMVEAGPTIHDNPAPLPDAPSVPPRGDRVTADECKLVWTAWGAFRESTGSPHSAAQFAEFVEGATGMDRSLVLSATNWTRANIDACYRRMKMEKPQEPPE